MRRVVHIPDHIDAMTELALILYPDRIQCQVAIVELIKSMVFTHFEYIWIKSVELDTPEIRKFQLQNQPIENLQRTIEKYKHRGGMYVTELKEELYREIERRTKNKDKKIRKSYRPPHRD